MIGYEEDSRQIILDSDQATYGHYIDMQWWRAFSLRRTGFFGGSGNTLIIATYRTDHAVEEGFFPETNRVFWRIGKPITYLYVRISFSSTQSNIYFSA